MVPLENKMNQKNKSHFLSSLIWKFLERGSAQGIQFFVQLVLARLLLPEDYGQIALVVVFISLANVLVQSGLNSALIQKKVIDELDLSSVFYLSLFMSIILYFVLYITSPFIADFYRINELQTIIRVFSITIIISSFYSVQYAIVARNMQFKIFFLSTVVSSVVSGIVGILLALKGYGVWALVFQNIINQIISNLILWFVIKWRPKLLFSIKRIIGLFSYGWKLLLSSLLNTGYMEAQSLLIGKVYTTSSLGFFNRGQQFPSLIVTNIDGTIQSVLFPFLSSYQSDIETVKFMVRRVIKTSSFLVFPMMIGLAIIAEPLVLLLLTEKWLPAVPFLQIFSLSYAFTPIHTANLQAINSLGRSDIFLKLELIKKTIAIFILVWSIRIGIYAVALGSILNGIISSFINAYPNKSLLNYTYFDQIKDISPSFLLTVFMGSIVYSLGFLGFPPFKLIIIQVVVGVGIYFMLAHCLKIESYVYLRTTLKEMIVKKV